MKLKFLIGVVVCGLTLFGCGGDGNTGATGDHDGHSERSGLGEPGDPGEADRTIEVVASDSPFRFTPDEISVAAGDTIVFELVNEGAVGHEFVLAEEPTEEATDGHEHSADPNATKRAEPGESERLVWTFTEPGEYAYECHVDGHHLAGMRGTITVSE